MEHGRDNVVTKGPDASTASAPSDAQRELREVRAELEQLRYAVDRGMEGFSLHDAEGRFTYVNRSEADMYGYTVEELLGQTWEVLYDEAQLALIRDTYFPIVVNKGQWRGELLGRRKDGSKFPVEVSLTLLNGCEGNPTGLVCTCSDITERKLADDSVRQLQKMDAVGQLTGGVAHDFNNLLSVILGELDLATHSLPVGTPARTSIDHALDAVERAATLTQRLLAFSRKQSLEPTRIQLNSLVSDTAELLRRTLGERVRVEVKPAPDLGECIADPSQLENALLNLAINARDAMPGGGTLTLRTSYVKVPDGLDRPAGNFARVSLEDTGTGIEAEMLERIYEPFFTTKAVGAGSGLGLSMVYGFVMQSGGHLSVDSEVGRGTEFHIDLPCAGTPDACKGEEEPADVRRERILVVEDDPNVQRVVVAQLELLGYEVEAAGDARAALDTLNGPRTFQLLLSDLVLPGGRNGVDLAREARKARPDVRLVLMSGYAEGALTEDAREIADAPLLHKPFRSADLARSVRLAMYGE